MGGGGGDGGYAARQAEIEAQKQRARDALNAAFGIAPTGTPSSVTRDQFTTHPATGHYVSNPNTENMASTWVADPAVFDQAGYDAAVAAAQAGDATVAKNKAARDALYTTVRTNAFDSGRRRLDEDRERAARDLKFALFAQGLNGGSADVDENALLGRTYTQGILDLGAKADATKTDMMGSDEQTRLGLLQSIDAGMDQGSALSSALQQMQVNSARAASAAQGTDLGDLFGDAGLLYTKSQAARGAQAAGQQPWWNTYAAPSYGKGKGGAATGTVTGLGG